MHESSRAFLECAYKAEHVSHENHFHNAHELIYICEGAAEFRIGNSCYAAGPHSILFIGKLEEHSVRPIGGVYRRYYIQLTPEQLDRCTGDPALKSAFISRPAGVSHMYDISVCASDAEGLLGGMLREHSAARPHSRDASESMFRLLMILCSRACENRFPMPPGHIAGAIYEIQKYIDLHFTEDIRLEQLAKDFYISPSYLTHSFREWTGNSPKQYLVRSRIAYARELLLSTDKTVEQTGSECGFGDTSNFIRAFRRETGQTPLKYRKEGKKRY